VQVIESENSEITIEGAREHNLKGISLVIPRNKFVVITGVSGSGKSTIAFDILFAEGQRRFLDSMNAYARQFVEQLPRPDVDLVSGIPPTVSIEQRNSRGGGKSTVATVTEIYHFLRLLFARLGTQFCPHCQAPVEAQTRDQVGRRLEADVKVHGELTLLAPVVRNRKGFHTEVAEWASKHGYAQIRADGRILESSERLRLDRFSEHNVEIVTGIFGRPKKSISTSDRQKLVDETIALGHGILYAVGGDGKVVVHSTERACPVCGESFAPIDPKMLSYNSPQGWCPTCRGFGETFYLPDVDRGARAESIEESWFDWQDGKREICSECGGTRLNPIARAVRLVDFSLKPGKNPIPDNPTLVDFSNASVDDVLAYVQRWQLKGRQAEIARDIVPEIRERLRFLREVGLNYLQLGRGATTLSGGEAQRIRLAAQLGSNLSGVLYVLDEPTIGLHARDNEKLLAALKLLKSRGNSLVVVEHDEATMREADYIIDLGPGAGVLGGQVVAHGTLSEIMKDSNSTTGKYLRGHKTYPANGRRRPVTLHGRHHTPMLVLSGAKEHNLKNLKVSFPLNRFICVTGVSGSGKSTLIRDCLLPAIRAKINGETLPSGSAVIASGHEMVRAVYEVDQSPIGRTPRSIPATYVGFFDEIRQLFAQIPEARMRGYSASRFSFNSAQGRCPECQGAGTVKLEMNFMPPAFVRCQTCGGTRFNRETLDIQFHGLNISQVLDLSVAQALEFFSAFQKIARPLKALCDTGLEYVKLGQNSPTLSGGEAQRLKLVTHLLTGLPRQAADEEGESRATAAPGCLFLLEEPTIGLHMADVKKLVEVLQRLVDAGHTVVVIEHNLDLIAEADWLIDLGPEGGSEGGRIVAQGTPEDVAADKVSRTAPYLRKML